MDCGGTLKFVNDVTTILTGDCREILPTLPDESVQCCVTSPPYYGLRDYGVTGQIGLEKSPEQYIKKLVWIFREVRRVLKKDGTLWLNLGDSYANDGKWGGHTGGKHVRVLHASPIGLMKKCTGFKPKDLMMIPARVAIALQADGWWLRQDIIWNKPSAMPESVTDRCTKSHEYIFLLTKSLEMRAKLSAAKKGILRTEHVKNKIRDYWAFRRASGEFKTRVPYEHSKKGKSE